jgi:hypothetical protein
MSIFGLYILSSVPGLIAAMLVRLWAHHRKWGRNERAWLFALTIGLLCSPGLYVAGQGIPVVVPSLFAAIFATGQIRKMWGIFLVSTTITTFFALGAYVAVSKIRSAETKREET